MTINTTTNRVEYSGDAVSTVFSFPYYFLADADLVVIETVIATGVQTTKTLATHYTLSGAGNPAGGSVTMLTAPASTVTLTIYRDPSAIQDVDLVEGDPLPVETAVEQPLDKLTMIAQRVKELIGRALRLPEGDTGFVAADTYLPAEVDRASKYLAFDADGKPVATAGTTSNIIVAGFIETLLDDASAAAARTTLGAVGLTGNETISGNKTITGDTTFQSSDAGASQNPTVVLDRNSASPAASDVLGAVPFKGRDSGAGTDVYAQIQAEIVDPTAASEDGKLAFQTVNAGTLATRVSVGQGLVIGAPTGGDKGAGTANATSVYENNQRVYSGNSVITPAPQALTAGGAAYTFAHTLGAVPKLYRAVLRCVTPENNWTAGDEIDISSSHDAASVDAQIGADATNVIVEFSGTPVLLNKTAAGTAFTPATGSGQWVIAVYVWS